MRQWIALIENLLDYSKRTPQELEHEASMWSIVVPGDPPEAGMKADAYDWHYDPAYPLSKFAGGDWAEWMREEIEMWAEEGDPDRFDNMFDRPIEEPVILTEVNGQGWLWDGCHRVGASVLAGRETIPAIVGKPKAKLKESEDFDVEGWSDDVDPSYEQDFRPARLPATPENVARAKDFVLRKMIDRHHEKYGHIAALKDEIPTDLSNTCKFSSLFAREIFGGRLRGSQAHQFVELPDGKVLDLNIDAQDVRKLGPDAHFHDDQFFWGNPDHKDALDSCRPRVEQWVKEFLQPSTSKT